MQEIERRWLIPTIPSSLLLELPHPEKIVQGYFYLGKTLVRLRKVVRQIVLNGNDQVETLHYLTLKAGCALVRKEVEVQISEADFKKYFAQVHNMVVHKTRYKIFSVMPTHKVELDIFEKNLKGLAIVEIEFESEDQANRTVDLPSWFGREVTEEMAEYSNASLARRGLPETWKSDMQLPFDLRYSENISIST